MKKNLSGVFTIVWLGFFIALASCGSSSLPVSENSLSSSSEVTSVPISEVQSMSKVHIFSIPAGVDVYPDATAKVGETNLPIYNVKTNNDHIFAFEPPRQNNGVIIFQLEGVVRLDIKTNYPIDASTRVLPSIYNIVPTHDLENQTISFEIYNPGFYTVEPNRDPKRTIHIFVDQYQDSFPHVPADANTLYFGPGLHTAANSPYIDSNNEIRLQSNQTVFIDYGAVVRGKIYANQVENIKILGGGIIDGSTFSKTGVMTSESGSKSTFIRHQIKLSKNEVLTLKIIARVRVARRDWFVQDFKAINKYTPKVFDRAFRSNEQLFAKKWLNANVDIIGEPELDFALKYSIYHLLILGSETYPTSIPARGLSGQTYKGAIFWDTEIFMLPFFLLTNQKVARRLMEYRIDALPGALAKAQRFGHVGAFYAWEGQEKGKEACSMFNVSDAVTGRPIRTYFVDKQVHISADVAYGIIKYVFYTGDRTILEQGGYRVLLQIMKFYRSYSYYRVEKDRFEIHDVIGPDEYHERVNNNAFTNYLVYQVGKKTLELFKGADPVQTRKLETSCTITLDLIEQYLEKLYLPTPNHEGIIEQFDGYFDLEDADVSTVRARVKNPKEYWGGEHGVASGTKVIKQADVIAIFGLFPDLFPKEIIKANYDYYSPYTEHGSSLSASMYGLAAIRSGYYEDAYRMMKKSAMIDLGEAQKQWAGSIYIGGTHPASNGGAYLCAVYGFAGLQFIDNQPTFIPQLPENITAMMFNFCFRGETQTKLIKKENTND